MYILLVSGVMVWVPKGTTWAQRLTFIEVMTARKRVCATFYIAHVAGVFYDNEGITAEKLT